MWGASGAPHAMAVNETVLAFVRDDTPDGAAGGVGTAMSWTTEGEFTLRGRRKVHPGAAREAPETGVPVLMVQVNCSTMSRRRSRRSDRAFLRGGGEGPSIEIISGPGLDGRPWPVESRSSGICPMRRTAH